MTYTNTYTRVATSPYSSRKIYLTPQQKQFSVHPLVYAILSLAMIFVAHSYYRDYLFNESLVMIENMQKNGRGTVLTIASKAVSMFLGGEVMMFIVFVITQSVGKPSRALYYLLMMIVNVFFTIFVKLIEHHPRPYMMVNESQIRIHGTSSEFGDPSGHTMSSAQVMLTLFLDYMVTQKNKKNTEQKYISFGVFYTVVVALVGYSRMYNGVHSLDQVITGGALGIWQGLVGHFFIREKLYEHVDNLTGSNEVDGPQDDCPQPLMNYLNTAVTYFLICFLSCIGAYYYCTHTFEIPQIWLDRQLSKSGDPGIFTFANASFIQCGALAMPLGCYLGILYRAAVRSDDYYTSVPGSQLRSLNLIEKVYRVLIQIALIGTAYGPYLLFIGVSNIYEAMVLTTLIPLGSICFISSAFIEEFYVKIGISYFNNGVQQVQHPQEGEESRKAR